MDARAQRPVRGDGGDQRPPLRARLLGETWLAIGHRDLAPGVWPRRTARSLLLLLLTTPGHRLPRERAIELLWPGEAPDRTRARWYQAVSTLRRVLEPELPPRARSRFLADDSLIVALQLPAGSWIDLTAYEEARARGRTTTPATRRAQLRSAIALYRGELLADEPDAGWVVSRREAVRSAWQQDVLELARLDLDAGEPLPSVAALQAVLAGDELFEDAHLALMQAFAAAGQRSRALRQFERCQTVLERELGLEARAELRLLAQSLSLDPSPSTRQVTPGPIGRGKAIRVLPPRAVDSTLVGRDREIDLVEDLLWRDDLRLVTLTGPGGIGKTRLAKAVLERFEQDFKGDLIYVPLASVPDSSYVLLAIRQAIGIGHDSGRSLVAQLRDHFAERESLLVLDNLEHVIEAAVEVGELLAACARLKVLATSRAPLRVAGEQVVDVSSLEVPDPRRTPFAALARSPAVALFTHRARAGNRAFQLTERNAVAVARLCQRLDGLPLAIELAAARVNLLTPAAMLARLDRHRDSNLLSDGPRDAPPRLRSLRDAVAWSHDLLTPAAQRSFRRLAVFTGGFTLDAAVALDIAGPVLIHGCRTALASEGAEARHDAVFHALQELLEHCLVRSEEQTDGTTRFRMLATIRDVAHERLAASGEEDIVRLRHAEWCLALAEVRGASDVNQWSRAWLERVAPEFDNVRAALAWLHERGDADRCLRLTCSLWWFWRTHGPLSEGRNWVHRALALGAPARKEDQAQALLMAGDLAWVQGDGAEAARFIDQSEAIWRELDDPSGVAQSDLARAFASLTSGDDAGAEAHFRRALAGLSPESDAFLTATAMTNWGVIKIRRGDIGGGKALLERAISTCRAANLTWGIAETLEHLGLLARDEGDLAQAADYFRESLAGYASEADRWGTGGQVVNVAVLAARSGRFAVAARLFGASARIYDELRGHTFMLSSFRDDYVNAIEATRGNLGESRFDALWSEGQAMAYERVVEATAALAREIAASARPGTPDHAAGHDNIVPIRGPRTETPRQARPSSEP